MATSLMVLVGIVFVYNILHIAYGTPVRTTSMELTAFPLYKGVVIDLPDHVDASLAAKKPFSVQVKPGEIVKAVPGKDGFHSVSLGTNTANTIMIASASLMEAPQIWVKPLAIDGRLTISHTLASDIQLLKRLNRKPATYGIYLSLWFAAIMLLSSMG